MESQILCIKGNFTMSIIKGLHAKMIADDVKSVVKRSYSFREWNLQR